MRTEEEILQRIHRLCLQMAVYTHRNPFGLLSEISQYYYDQLRTEAKALSWAAGLTREGYNSIYAAAEKEYEEKYEKIVNGLEVE